MSTEFFSTASNIATHIEDSKAGERTVLLLHGYLETMYVWEDLFHDLSRDFRVIRIDLPGHGLTCSAPVNSIDLMATVAKGVLDVCGVKTASVIGHSLGGFVAIKCCELFPERFDKMILLNSHPFAEGEERKALALRETELIETGHLMQLADISIPRMFHPGNLRRLDETIREMVEMCETHDPAGIISSLKGMMNREDTSEYLASAGVPAMAVCGGTDTLVTPEIRAEMVKKIPSLRLEVLPECCHHSLLECRERTTELIKEFL